MHHGWESYPQSTLTSAYLSEAAVGVHNSVNAATVNVDLNSNSFPLSTFISGVVASASAKTYRATTAPVVPIEPVVAGYGYVPSSMCTTASQGTSDPDDSLASLTSSDASDDDEEDIYESLCGHRRGRLSPSYWTSTDSECEFESERFSPDDADYDSDCENSIENDIALFMSDKALF